MDLNSQKPSWLPKFLVLLAVIVAGGVGAYLQKQSDSSDSKAAPDLAVTGIKSSDGEPVTAVVTPDNESEQDDTTTDASSTVASISPAPSTSLTTTTASTTAPTTSEYTNGTYSAIGDYTSPGGPETVDVTLTVVNGLVVDATVEGNAVNPISKKFQAQFIAGYRGFVVGKMISSLSLTTVSGSSLTPKGFNDAVSDIRTQAKG